MPSPKELREDLVEARAELQAALHEAHTAWEQKPAGASEGEDAWCPRQVAEHVIGAELFFANGVAQACGAPGPERQAPDVSSPAAAAASLTRFAAKSDNILRHVSQDDLAKTHTMRIGELSVEQMLTVMASHARDHAQQIRSACQ
jgi:hypothetical protein